MRRIAPFFFILVITISPDASAWGWDGHRLICALAETRLTPKAKVMVDEYLADGGALKEGVVDFPDACVWPDDVKYSTRQGTYEHHFINVPDGADTLDLQRDCAASNCIAVGVQQSLEYLYRKPSGKRDVTRRAAALRFLGHYVGDLHQPLHTGNASDWGGNKIKVNWLGKSSNLHAVWDYKMMETMKVSYPDSLDYLKSVPLPETAGDVDVYRWMNRSLALARSNAYANVDGSLIKSGDNLGMAYLNHNKPIVVERLVQAGARLADLLNRIARGERPVAIVISTPSTD